MPNDVQMPGRRLPTPLAGKLQRCFVERFAPEMLPRMRPPYWGDKFQKAALQPSSYLNTPEFLQRRRSLCLLGRELPKPARKGERAIHLCTTHELAALLTSLHWSVRFDFYIFDKTCTWFVAALGERIYQMDERGEYPLLVYQEVDMSSVAPDRSHGA